MKSRSPQFFASGGTRWETWANVEPWSKEAATTGYHWLAFAIMKAAYTVPSGPTATAGSHAFTFEPRDSGTWRGVSNVNPPSVDRANAIPWQPIQVSYTYPSAASTACSTSAFCPESHAWLTSAIGLSVKATPEAVASRRPNVRAGNAVGPTLRTKAAAPIPNVGNERAKEPTKVTTTIIVATNARLRRSGSTSFAPAKECPRPPYHFRILLSTLGIVRGCPRLVGTAGPR